MVKYITLVFVAILLFVPAVAALTWSGGPGSVADNDFHLYLNGSTYSTIIWNVSEADTSDGIFHFPVYPGEQYIFGETFE